MTGSAAVEQGLTPQQQAWVTDDRRFQWRLAALWTVLAPALLVALMALWPDRRADEPVPWSSIGWAGVAALVFVATTSFLAIRRREGSPAQRRLVLSGDRSTIRRVRRQLRQGRPVAEDEIEVARAIVLVVRDLRWQPLISVAPAVLILLPLVLLGGTVTAWEVALRTAGAGLLLAGAVVGEVGCRLVLAGAERQRIWTVDRRATEAP